MTSAVTPEGFAQYLDDVLEPADYPGDDVVEEVMVDWTDEAGQIVGEKPEFRPVRDRWSIRDDGAAAWAIRRRARALDEIAKARALADEQIRQIEAYVETVKREHDRTATFFEGKLREFYEVVFLPNRPGKSYTKKLPGGALKSTAGGVQTIVEDPDALREWLKQHAPECLSEPKEPEPMRDAVKARFGGRIDDEPGEIPAVVSKDDPSVKSKSKTRHVEPGEVVPGVKFVRGTRTFKVEEDAK